MLSINLKDKITKCICNGWWTYKNKIIDQLYDLTQIQIELGEVPKNAHDVDKAATRRIATMQWSQGKVDDMNPEQIMRFQELLKAPFRTELLDEIGFTDAEKHFGMTINNF